MFQKISAIMMLVILAGAQTIFSQDKKPADMKKPTPLSIFTSADIGNPSIHGIVKILPDGIDITAGGEDIWGVKDEFTFAYAEIAGDFDVVTRVESLEGANLYTKAGIMAREDLTADCRHIFFQVFPDNSARNNNNGGYEFQYRMKKAGEMKAIYPAVKDEFPVKYPETWIRLQRKNNDFTGYYSTDGITWKLYTTFSLELPSKIFIGMAVTSHNTAHSATAKFRNISDWNR